MGDATSGTTETSLVVHFSGAKIEHVDEVEGGILVAYDADRKIVDITVRGRSGASTLDLVAGSGASGVARLTYDAEIDAPSIDASDSASEEVMPGFIADYDTEGFVGGFEFLDASQFFSVSTMADLRKCAGLI